MSFCPSLSPYFWKRTARKDTVNEANSVRIMVRKNRREEEGETGLPTVAL